MKRNFILFLFALSTLQINAAPFTVNDVEVLKNHLFANITYNGAVLASPSRYYPDYYYDWVRDSAIAMDLIETWYEIDQHPEDKARLFNYVYWVKTIQHQVDELPGQDILGEPKFYLDGHPYNGPWGRPQNDGPALRAITLTRFAQSLLKTAEISYVRTHLYGGGLNPDTMGVIKTDLEFIAHHWQDKNYDLWEEIYGSHFFTTMVQKKALIEGAKLARTMNDPEAATFYEQQIPSMEFQLQQYLDNTNHIISATLAPHPGPQKPLELDMAVVLGVLLGQTPGDSFTIDNDYVKHTIKLLREQFKLLFPINKRHSNAYLFGRYPGDTYDGYRNDSIGNPWFILTASMAEYYYRLAGKFSSTEERETYIDKGDAYLKLIKYYAPDLMLSEQINLNTGVQQGAISLTWSYVAVLRAIHARKSVAI